MTICVLVLSEAKMMATQRHWTRRASRIARSERRPRVSTTVEYKWPLCCLFWSLYIVLHAIFISRVIVCVPMPITLVRVAHATIVAITP